MRQLSNRPTPPRPPASPRFALRAERAMLLMTPPTRERLESSELSEFDRGVAEAFAISSVVAASDPLPLRRQVDQFNPDVIIAAGGDGTVNLALQAMRAHDSLALLPLGTANDLARYLGVQRNPGFLGSFVLSAACNIDVLRVNEQRFCTTGGLGLPAEVAHRVNVVREEGRGSWLESLGARIYPVIGAECCLRTTPIYRLKIEWEDLGDGSLRAADVQTPGLFVTNQSTFARSLQVVRDADNADGVFELCIMLVRGRMPLLRLLGGWSSDEQPGPGELRVIRTRRARIVADREVRFYGDGEVLDKGSCFELGIEPSALRLLS
ncbi:MAG: hypothetical protein HC927_06240 [Deltaproteobacteria bacterium]|nr:hypothetical protein [Deltaproteobacteria bacterium]